MDLSSSGCCDAQRDFVTGKIAEAEEEVVDRVGGTSALIFAEELEVGFDFRDGDGVEEFAEVGFAEKVGKQRLIDRESSGAAFGERGVAVINEVAGVSEQQGCREGRGLVGVDDVDLDFLFLDGAENVDEGGHVEGVAKAFAMRFEEHGEGGIARGDSEEIGSAFALLPERGANLGAAAGKEERAGGGFAEFCSEERGGAELADDQELRVGGVGEKESGIGGRVGVGETQNEAVVGGHGFDVGTAGVGEFARRRPWPRGCGCGCRKE